MPTGAQIVLAIIALVFMRWGGLISSLWTGLGLLGFIVILALLQYLPAFKRFAAAAFVLWVVFSFGLPALGAAFRADWPILGEALTDAAVSSELTAAERNDPAALQARLGARRFCRDLDRLQGVWLSQRFSELQNEVTSAVRASSGSLKLPEPSGARRNQLLKWIDTIEEQRLQCRAAILRDSGEEKGATVLYKWLTAGQRLLLMFLALGLVCATVVAAVLNAWRGKPFVGLAVLAVVVLLAWLAADNYIGSRSTAPFGSTTREATFSLPGHDRWLDVKKQLPREGAIGWETRQAMSPRAKFNDGSTAPLRGDVRARGDIVGLSGDGVVIARWRE
ncbi:MAG: hypothetical protein HY474_00805 [Candidatus Sungbacteria bacterium]|uniref:Uncharacterized protein n=1 Tax=Candidatus Sungiibacteriota bacterium TaxID=2750080 RepID=A0A932YVK8_9BACT|nr:hypothetical protein [Candidatus Sungbacteria bacterium]